MRLKINPGERFNMLTVISEGRPSRLPCGQPNRIIICKCDCGTIKQIRLLHLIRNRIISCGCIAGEKHHCAGTPIYRVWSAMIQRCHAPYASAKNKQHYQKKGIIVCDEWKASFTKFKDWALANGYEPGLQIDRKNNSLNYCPENCRWVTRLINVNNRDCTVRTIINNKPVSVRELLSLSNVEKKYFDAICKRVSRGWDYKRAITTPFKSTGYLKK